jgi:hypothetical protein
MAHVIQVGKLQRLLHCRCRHEAQQREEQAEHSSVARHRCFWQDAKGVLGCARRAAVLRLFWVEQILDKPQTRLNEA